MHGILLFIVSSGLWYSQYGRVRWVRGIAGTIAACSFLLTCAEVSGLLDVDRSTGTYQAENLPAASGERLTSVQPELKASNETSPPVFVDLPLEDYRSTSLGSAGDYGPSNSSSEMTENLADIPKKSQAPLPAAGPSPKIDREAATFSFEEPGQ